MNTELSTTTSERTTCKLLVVDDNDAMRCALSRWLTVMLPDSHVEHVECGEDAVRATRQAAQDAVLMDMNMPGMGGFAATRLIKLIAPHTHVVLFSLTDAEPYRVDADDAGASAFVLKRNIRTELLPLLHTLLQHEHTGPTHDTWNPPYNTPLQGGGTR